MKGLNLLTLLLACICCLPLLSACSSGDDDDDDAAATDDDAGTDDDSGATDDDDDDNDDSGDDDNDSGDDDDDDSTPPPGCDTLTAGYNKFTVNGVIREFYLDLPDGVADSWPWPLVFSWHGFGDTAANFRSLLDWQVNNDYFPFILVTVEDTGMIFDWDILAGTAEDNREVMLFDALVAEVDKCWGVDPQHIHTTGFSFGGGVSDLLGTRRGDMIASIPTCSGVYGNDPANVIPYTVADWPEFTVENKYVELRLHGGVLDNMVLPFGQYGENDRIFLNEHGHDVIECIHPYIHNMGFMYMGPETFVEFMYDHPLGTTESPYKDGMPADYPKTCTYRPKQ